MLITKVYLVEYIEISNPIGKYGPIDIKSIDIKSTLLELIDNNYDNSLLNGIYKQEGLKVNDSKNNLVWALDNNGNHIIIYKSECLIANKKGC